MSRRRLLAVVAWLYFVEGLPFALFRDVLPVHLRLAGMPLEQIGVVSGFAAAWSLKALWSPLVDRYGEYRSWILGALMLMALSLASIARMPAGDLGTSLMLAIAVFCAASATQDVAIDAYSIGFVPRGEEGPANGVRITAYRVAMIAGGGLLLLLPRWIGWPATLAVAAGLMLSLAAGAARIPGLPARESRRDARDALRALWRRPGAATALAFVLLYRIGDLAMTPMLKPFWVDRGLSAEEIGLVSTTLGAAMTIAGAIFGGRLVVRRGIPRALLLAGVLALGSNLVYAAVARWPASGRAGIYGASFIEAFCSGVAAAAFLAFLMRACSREHAAVQYACLSALYALPGTFAGTISGRATVAVGYDGWFAATALLAIPSLGLLGGARAWSEGTPSTPHEQGESP